ncbi:MAG: YitT family protein [Clostridium sp.]
MKKQIKDYIVILIGVMLVAGGVYFFLMPNDIAAGGINGLAMVVNKFIPALPVGAVMFGIDLVLFIVAFTVIGANFGAKTIFASFSLSGTILVLEKLVPMTTTLTNDMFIELIFGIIIQAMGLALVFNADASTGGTDIIAKIINKYTKINIGKAILLADLVVVLLALIAFGFKSGLYSLFAVILNGLVIDKVIEGLNVCMEIKVVSPEIEKIEKFILDELGRGATRYYGMGSYSKKDMEILLAILDRNEFIKLKNYIKEVDPAAFVSVTEAYDTLGEGFKKLA